MSKELNHILYHLGEDRNKYFNAIAPPVIQSSIFSFDTIGDFQQAISSEESSHVYGRGNNPTVEILRKKLAALEGAEDAIVVGSGAAAVATAVMSCVGSGDHIICVKNPYSWTHALVENYLARFGVEHTFVDGQHPDDFNNNIQSFSHKK